MLFINDLDAGIERMGGTTQYTVNNKMVNATLMNIADNPTNVQLPGRYKKQDNPRVPIIVTGNDFSTLYAQLILEGRMDNGEVILGSYSRRQNWSLLGYFSSRQCKQ